MANAPYESVVWLSCLVSALVLRLPVLTALGAWDILTFFILKEAVGLKLQLRIRENLSLIYL
jgi:hypothetical protein